MNRGFTLVEMLGVITLLGILAVVIGVDVNMRITESRKNTCRLQEENIIDAAKMYYIDYPEELPLEGDVHLGITKTLIDDGYLEQDLTNPMSNKVYSDKSYVNVSTQNGKKFNYKVIYINEKDCDGK